MKVSVIVPIYKVEKYLNKCVESIINQTYSNLEIILVDDGSPDNCPTLCDGFAKNDSRIKVIHKKNAGVSSARNAGMKVATGKYFYFCDPDDFLEPYAIERLVSAIENADLVIAGYNTIYNGNITETNLQNLASLQNEEVFNSLVHGWFGTLWNKLFKKELIKVNFNETCKWVEDLPFVIEYLKNVNNFTIVPEPIYNYIKLREGALTIAIKETSSLQLQNVHSEIVACHNQTLNCLESKKWVSSISHENASFLRSYINIFQPFITQKLSKQNKQLIISFLNQDITQSAFKNYTAVNLKEKVFIKLLKGKHLKTLIFIIKIMEKKWKKKSQ